MLINEITAPGKKNLDENPILTGIARIFKWLTKPKPGTPKPAPKPKPVPKPAPKGPGIKPKPGAGGWWNLGWFAWTLITLLLPVAGYGLQIVIGIVSSIISNLIDNNTVEDGEIEAELKAAGVPEEDMPELIKQIQDSIDKSDVVATLQDRDRDPSREELEKDLEELYKNFDESDFEDVELAAEA